MRILRHVRVPVRDGTRLAADVYLPDADGPVPAVIQYQPYRKDDAVGASVWQHRLPAAGYAFVQLDVRGSGGSEGVSTDEYLPVEQQDGHDAVEWFARQPWCDGQLSFWGSSYSGFTGLQVAATRPPHLRTVMTMYFTDDRYTDDCHVRGGLLGMYYDAGTYETFMVAMNALPPDPGLPDWERLWREHMDGQQPYQLTHLRRQLDGPYWRAASPGELVDRIDVPVLMIGGWRDGYPNPPLRLFAALRGPRRVIIGPWNHFGPDVALPGPRIDHVHEVIRWLDHWCKGAPNGVMDEPPVTVFMQHGARPLADRVDTPGEWRGEMAWPVPGAAERTMPLVTGIYRHRATLGAAAGGLWSGGLPFGLPGDQRVDDGFCVVTRSEPLDEPLAILGRPRVTLRIRADAPVVAVVARLCDIAPDGAAELVAKGVLNATRRTSLREPVPLVPGEATELTVEVDTTGWVFQPGHRIGLALGSSDFPNLWPTPFPATVEVLEGALTLPMVPAQGSAQPPMFRAASVVAAPLAALPDRPTWDHRTDVLTGRESVEVRVTRSWQAAPDCAAGSVREWTATADPDDPAHATMTGRQWLRRTWPGLDVEADAMTTITSTEAAFEIRVELTVRRDGDLVARRSWRQVDERVLL